MHFLKSCTAANESSRKRLLWKLFKITIMAVRAGSSLVSTVGCFWSPNQAHRAKWIMKGYSARCQNKYLPSSFFLFVASHICTLAIHWLCSHTRAESVQIQIFPLTFCDQRVQSHVPISSIHTA